MRKIFLTLGLFVALGVCAQETVKVTANKFNGYGIVYSLPKTAIDIRVTLSRTVEKPGPFAQYAQKYLGENPTITKKRTVWKIEQVDILPKGIADPEKRYAIQLKKENRTAFYLNKEGMLVSINQEPKAEPLAPQHPRRPVAIKKKEAKKEAEYAQLYTESMLISSSVRNMAETAAQQIYLLREYRLDLLTGNSDEIPQGQSFEILLREMNKRESLLTSLFLGTAESETIVKDIIVSPDKNNTVAFRFSEQKGILPDDDLSGEPVYIQLDAKEIVEAPTDAKGKVIAPAQNALVYITPGKADVSALYKGESLCQKEIPMAQLGAEFGIDPSVFSGSGAVEATFCPESGALLHIGIADEKPVK